MSAAPDIQAAYAAELDSHLNAVSAPTRALLHELIGYAEFAGSTDPPALGALLAIVRAVQPPLMLELGTHVGVSALCVADVLEHNNYVKGKLVTVDPNTDSQQLARDFVTRAGLEHRVTFVTGYSTEPEVVEQLRDDGPFRLAYLDSSHSYRGTLEELDHLFADDGGWLSEDGLVIAHDAAPEAAVFDPTGEGGVPRALAEWNAERAGAYELFVLRPPVWPCGCGLGLVQRAGARPAVPPAG